MQTSSVIDVAFGLATIFLIFSLLVSGANELISTVLSERSAFLFRGLKQLLENEDKKGVFNGYTPLKTDSTGASSPLAVEKVLTHPLAWPSLAPTIWPSNGTKHPPSYFSPETFGTVAADLLLQSDESAAKVARVAEWAKTLPDDDASKPLIVDIVSATGDRALPADKRLTSLQSLAEIEPSSPTKDALKAQVAGSPSDFDRARAAAAAIPSNTVRDAVVALIDDADGDIDKLRTGFSKWYDAQMDRVSGWYKRRKYVVSIVLGLVIAFGVHVDTVALAQRLYDNPAQLQTVVAVGSKADCAAPGSSAIAAKDLRACSDSLLAGIDSTSLGLFAPQRPDSWLAFFSIVLAGFLLALGAPFWFGVLGKIAPLRNTGPKPPTTAES
jgi:hypothetical protein